MSEFLKYTSERKSFQSLNKPYFWTSVIQSWKHLLKLDEMKMTVIESFQWLTHHEFVEIYGYVIMPNHIHVVWEQLKMNGKEMPKASFEKYTGHMFLRKLRSGLECLDDYKSNQSDRNYKFWQRDPLAILISNRKMAGKILDYVHYNPLQPHWQLCNDAVDYRFSSARFYETGNDEFKILTHLMDKF